MVKDDREIRRVESFIPMAAADDIDTLAFKLGVEKCEVINLAVICGLEQLWTLLNFKSSEPWTGEAFKEHMIEVFSVRPARAEDYSENH